MKVNLKVKLSGCENLDITVKGIKKDNTIKYLEGSIKVLITIYEDRITINRKHPDYEVDLNLELNKKTISTYTFVGGNKVFNLSTKTEKLEISDNKIFAKYILEENEFIFTLEVI